jgi:hypothetical protein
VEESDEGNGPVSLLFSKYIDASISFFWIKNSGNVPVNSLPPRKSSLRVDIRDQSGIDPFNSCDERTSLPKLDKKAISKGKVPSILFPS